MKEEALTIWIINADGPAIPAKILTRGKGRVRDVTIQPDQLDHPNWCAVRKKLVEKLPLCFGKNASDSGPLKLNIPAGDFIRHAHDVKLVAF